MNMGLIHDDNHVRAICRIGQGHACCRYLTIGADGWDCVKLDTTPIQTLQEVMEGQTVKRTAKDILDDRVARHDMTARGDNCEGR